LLEGLKSLGKRESSNDASSNDLIPLPDLHRNALALTRWSILRAYFAIAKVLDFSAEDLHSKTLVSPFYQPEAAQKGDLNTILATYNAKAIRNLRPTAAQILHKHHPWLDIIPFPSIRERTLTLASLSPPLVDMNELQNDIFLNDGLFCWKSDGKRGDGQPWDLRSWYVMGKALFFLFGNVSRGASLGSSWDDITFYFLFRHVLSRHVSGATTPIPSQKK
jgi:hypothetical protein